MDITRPPLNPVTTQKLLGTAKNFAGYMLALAIVVWGFTFALMNVWLVIASLIVAMFLGAGLLMVVAAKLAVQMGVEPRSE